MKDNQRQRQEPDARAARRVRDPEPSAEAMRETAAAVLRAIKALANLVFSVAHMAVTGRRARLTRAPAPERPRFTSGHVPYERDAVTHGLPPQTACYRIDHAAKLIAITDISPDAGPSHIGVQGGALAQQIAEQEKLRGGYKFASVYPDPAEPGGVVVQREPDGQRLAPHSAAAHSVRELLADELAGQPWAQRPAHQPAYQPRTAEHGAAGRGLER